ncbi:MAG: single-stranded DNA-binding protein [Bacteroidia bacterium]
MSLNKVMLIGNLGRDPEVRYLDNNKVVASFTIATNETYTDKNGEKRTETEWHRVEMWDNLAKIAEKYLKKGNQVFVEGKIKTENWKDKEGIERSDKRIRVTNMTLLGSRQADSIESTNTGKPTNQPIAESNTVNYAENYTSSMPAQEDDLPF